MRNLSTFKVLEPHQKDILIKFILTFLPQRGNKRKGSKNEIEYISMTIDRILHQHFSFHIDREHVLNAFEELKYPIFLKKSKWNADKKEHVPSNQGTYIRLDNVYKDHETAFIYVDIEPSIVGQLRLVTSGLPPHTNKGRQDEKEEMTKRIYLFKQTIKDRLNAS